MDVQMTVTTVATLATMALGIIMLKHTNVR